MIRTILALSVAVASMSLVSCASMKKDDCASCCATPAKKGAAGAACCETPKKKQ